MLKEKDEDRLLKNFRGMSESDKAWLIALSDGCGKPYERQDVGVTVITSRSSAGEKPLGFLCCE